MNQLGKIVKKGEMFFILDFQSAKTGRINRCKIITMIADKDFEIDQWMTSRYFTSYDEAVNCFNENVEKAIKKSESEMERILKIILHNKTKFIGTKK